MENKVLVKQVDDAKRTFNYFLMKLTNRIICCIFIMSFALVINQASNTTIITLLTSIIIILTFIIMLYFIIGYNKILIDIKETFKNEDFIFVVDINKIKSEIRKEVIKYGK